MNHDRIENTIFASVVTNVSAGSESEFGLEHDHQIRKYNDLAVNPYLYQKRKAG
jgi:hypothetical protein